ncbi:hypothetical protein DsansV1_C18g0154061 [Dioscorea sansibarensis]
MYIESSGRKARKRMRNEKRKLSSPSIVHSLKGNKPLKNNNYLKCLVLHGSHQTSLGFHKYTFGPLTISENLSQEQKCLFWLKD